MTLIKENTRLILYKIDDYYKDRFGEEPQVVIKSPGRVNIIGEHTDYNLGYVLPAAIDHYMFIGISKNNTDQVKLYSIDYEEDATLELSKITRSELGWLNLISGVVNQLKDKIGGFDLAFGGNIPQGAGVSSSAALCCGVTMAISELFELNLDKWKIAKVAQKSEHEFALVQCGIMDQFACLFGITNHVFLLDCNRLIYEESEAAIDGFRLLLINSNVSHSLNDSEYNKRKTESSQALNIIKDSYKRVQSYQDVNTNMLEELGTQLNSIQRKRAYHVVTENRRVMEMRDHLKRKEYEKAGELLIKGHQSLKDYYEVTCKETDFLVDELTLQKSVLGARQVGGGFGGCVLVLMKDSNVDETLKSIDASYKKKFNLKLDHIPIKISKGCHRIK